MINNLFKLMLICCVLTFGITQQGYSQVRKTMTFEDGEVTIIQGLGAVVKGDDNGLTVEMIPPEGMRKDEYKVVDLAAQDKIIMCNGKKVKTIEDLKDAISKVEIGGEISFGVKRGKEMMLVSFPKADPTENENMMMMTMEIDGDGSGEKTSIVKDGVELKDVVMFDAGLILKDIDGKPEVVAILPLFKTDGDKIMDGDKIVGLNGTKDLDSSELSEAYAELKIGEKVNITVLRDSKELTLTFTKSAPQDDGANVIIEK